MYNVANIISKTSTENTKKVLKKRIQINQDEILNYVQVLIGKQEKQKKRNNTRTKQETKNKTVDLSPHISKTTLNVNGLNYQWKEIGRVD